MTNPIPQRLPRHLIGTPRGRYIRELIDAAFQLREGNTTQIPNDAPDQYMQDLTKVLDQINKGEAANPLDYNPPYDEELNLFFKEFLNAIEQLR